MIETSGHLPECSNRPYNGERCICDRLRACEQRKFRESVTAGSAAYDAGYEQGVQDARDAVADARTWPTPLPHPAPSGFHAVVIKDDALAAIDALRGES